MASNNNNVIRTDYKITDDGEELFFVGEYGTGRERDALKFGLGKALKLLSVIDDYSPEEFRHILAAYVEYRQEGINASRIPLKTMNVAGKTYGLFPENVIKMERNRKDGPYWAKVTGAMADVLTPESFDNPESLSIPVAAAGRSKAPSATTAALAEMQAKLDAQAAQNAKLQEMMMQFMSAQMAAK